MAGHSAWKNIQHRKGRQDIKRGKVFTKVTKELVLAAKQGGGDPGANARLRTAIEDAKAVNLPKDKIETAIKKGTGELASDNLEEVMYEGYGPGGVALIVAAATDNRNRTVAEVRSIFAKNGGAMGERGSVGWMFAQKGVLTFDKAQFTEDQLLEAGLEAGVEDVTASGEAWEVHCAVEDFHTVKQLFDQKKMTYTSAELSMVPQNTVPVDKETAVKLFKLYDALDDYDDVLNVYANFDLADDVMKSMG